MKLALIALMLIIQVVVKKHHSSHNKVKYLMKGGSRLPPQDGFCQMIFKA